ncbi:MAG TPA: hypothetical protein VE978_12455 [Chitinophagales bacterium]|nr:hypothetical protein [Chitinophagales bacterium]
MKKGLISLAFALLLCSFSFGQTLHKGNLLGVHTLTPNLKEGVTMEDYVKFLKSKVIPAYNKALPGMTTYLIKSLRGQDSSSLGLIYMFDSEADRNKYFNSDGTPSKLLQDAEAKLSDIQKEMDKYQTSDGPDKYNDSLVK